MIFEHVDLFSGIGGFALAARWAGVETIQFCEIDEFAQRVLRKQFPGVPIHKDVKTFDATKFRKPFLLTGGYPCQPFSSSGLRRGEKDDRHLWPEMFRIIRDARPHWVLAENVAGHVSMGLDEVLFDLESEGYTAQPLIIPACAVDAFHRRDRVWIVGNSNGESINSSFDGSIEERSKEIASERSIHSRDSDCRKDVADSDGSRRTPSWNDWRMGWVRKPIEDSGNHDFERWLPEPDVGRVAHGIPSRVDRLKGLGNAIVPQVAYEIIKGMIDYETREV